MADKEQYKIVLMVSKEQELEIERTYKIHGWKYHKLDESVQGTVNEESSIQSAVTSAKKGRTNAGLKKTRQIYAAGRRDTNRRVPVRAPSPPPPEPPEPQFEDDECQFCFLVPCVATRNVHFLAPAQAACEENSAIRHRMYTSYWKTIDNLGGWNDPRYLNYKVHFAGGEWAVNHMREIMPRCVVEKLRMRFPNPEGIPYMGHKWN